MTVQNDTPTINIPFRFWNDRAERDLEMPKVLSATKTYIRVSANDPVIPDVLSDAEYYTDIVKMSGERFYLGLQSSARATVKAIRKALG
jgi:hypothetical protein